MRTTITIDDDILKEIESIAEREARTRRDVINNTLRRGLSVAKERDFDGGPFTTESRDLGRCLIPSTDNVAEVLAVAEGDNFR